MAFDSYSFTPGVPSLVYLPINGNRNIFTSTLKTGLSGGKKELDRCYGQYGIIWKWSTFEKSSSAFHILTSTRTIAPSSWHTMQCALSAGSTAGDYPGPYPKKWILGNKALSASFFNPILFSCSATPIIWTLSCENWLEQRTIPTTVSDSFDFELRLFDYGLLPYTASLYHDTAFTLNATISVDCLDTENLSSEVTFITETINFTAVAPPSLNFYTPNRFVLSGTSVAYENLITNIHLITALNIDFDDNKTLILTGNDIKNSHFVTNYDVLGFKTLKATAYCNYGNENVFTKTLPEVIRVLDKYDEISPEEYRIASESINLPWKNQPQVGSNDWVIEDNINNCFKQFHDNLEYLNSRSKVYNNTYADYFGYLGDAPTIISNVTAIPAWTWEDADCLNTSLDYNITWRDLLSADNAVDNGKFIRSGTWQAQECRSALGALNCTERGSLTGSECMNWNWANRKSTLSLTDAKDYITWSDTTSASKYAKKWRFEICPTEFTIICNTGNWNVNIPGLDRFYPDFAVPSPQPRCLYYSLFSKENKIYIAQKTEIKLLSSDRNAMYYSSRASFDGVLDFSSLECIRLDSSGKIFVLDSVLSQVASYKFLNNQWQLFTNWGGVGGGNFKFLNPQDLHVDQLDNIWITDTGNSCIKHYSNTGTWIKTINIENNSPISVCVDSQKQVHILTQKEILVYSYNGDFIFSYDYSEYVSENSPRKINTSYNREIIYLALEKQVLKFFRNGVFSGYIIQSMNNVYNIKDIFHDEYRNLLVATNDKIMKFSDLMTQTNSRGKSNFVYWSLNDLYIHKEEYVQNWVYNKSFQRLWDNIENFRNTLFFSQQGCKSYKPPVYGKETIILGQNEIVTSTVINRILNYLWINFNTLLDYFDPNCID